MGQTTRLSLLLLLLQLTACSSTTFIYNRLDFLLPWYLDGYVDLDRSQRGQFDQLLLPFLDWHRMEELPLYLDLVDSIVASLDEPVSTGTVARRAAEFEAAWFRLEGRAVEGLLELGAELSDAQIEEFLARLQKDQEKYQKKYLARDEEEYREDLHENFTDSARDFLGRLDWGQRNMLVEASAAMRRSDAVWLQERALWLQRLRELLRREPGWQQRVRDALAERDQTVSEEYSEAAAHNIDIVNRVVADLLNSRSDKQDRHLRRKLDDLREDMQTLIEQGTGG